MIELKKNFTKKGVHYQCLWYDEGLIIYECSRLDGLDTYWEVFKRRTHKANEFHSDEYVMYPSDENFGEWAWCCTNKKSMLKVLNKHFKDYDCPLTKEEIAQIAEA